MELDMVRVKRCLISVSDKSGVVDFARALAGAGVEVISTGGTAELLRGSGVQVGLVSELTGFPEILSGRVKTLHPKVFGGILARRDDEHLKEIEEQGINPIDMVVCNLYPFEEVVSKGGVALEEALEEIDIGGPSLLRAAAKNHPRVVAVSDPAQYEDVLRELEENDGCVSDDLRHKLACSAFELTSRYDQKISRYLADCESSPPGEEAHFPSSISLNYAKAKELRYGENPHQKSALYREPGSKELSVVDAQQLHGKALSFNNILDLDSALSLILEFDTPACCIMKHLNPCGVGVGESIADAYRRAHLADPVSAFGGIVGLNRLVDSETAEEIVSTFIEAVVAAGYAPEAIERFKKRKNLRVMVLPGVDRGCQESGWDVRKVRGGLLIQEPDTSLTGPSSWEVVTDREPTEKEAEALLFAWKVVKHVKSNGICLATKERTIGIGAGQMSRVDSVELAIKKAQGVGAYTGGTAMASDGFFPFRDSIDLANEAGVTAVIQPGGSIRDQEVIGACNEQNMAMVFSKERHFRH